MGKRKPRTVGQVNTLLDSLVDHINQLNEHNTKLWTTVNEQRDKIGELQREAGEQRDKARVLSTSVDTLSRTIMAKEQDIENLRNHLTKEVANRLQSHEERLTKQAARLLEQANAFTRIDIQFKEVKDTVNLCVNNVSAATSQIGEIVEKVKDVSRTQDQQHVRIGDQATRLTEQEAVTRRLDCREDKIADDSRLTQEHSRILQQHTQRLSEVTNAAVAHTRDIESLGKLHDGTSTTSAILANKIDVLMEEAKDTKRRNDDVGKLWDELKAVRLDIGRHGTLLRRMGGLLPADVGGQNDALIAALQGHVQNTAASSQAMLDKLLQVDQRATQHDREIARIVDKVNEIGVDVQNNTLAIKELQTAEQGKTSAAEVARKHMLPTPKEAQEEMAKAQARREVWSAVLAVISEFIAGMKKLPARLFISRAHTQRWPDTPRPEHLFGVRVYWDSAHPTRAEA